MNKTLLKSKPRWAKPAKTWESVFGKTAPPEFGPAFKADMELRAAWRLWHLSILRQWLESGSSEEGSISCLHCGNAMGLDVEPLLKGSKDGPPRPEEGQVLCLSCYGTGKDFRPLALRRFQAMKASEDWISNSPRGWAMKESPLSKRG